jgi:hypothetical protein
MLKQLEDRFKGFSFEINKAGNVHGFNHLDKFDFRTPEQNLLRIGAAHLFISTECCGSDGVKFFYGILYQIAEKRLYRHKRWNQFEANKLYMSGKTQLEVAQKFMDSNWVLQTK